MATTHRGAKEASIMCQLSVVPRTDSRLATWPKKTPHVIPSWQRTPTAPLCLNGAISVMYIGSRLVARPPDKPAKKSDK